MTVPSSGQPWAHYVGPLYHQIDGSAFEYDNCTLANLTTEMDCASDGFWRVPASRLRVMSGDTSGGLTYDQIVALAPRATGNEVHVARMYYIPVSNVVTLLKAPRTVHISILCSVTLNTPFHTGNFTGRHNIGLYDYRVYAWTDSTGTHSQQQVLVGDPGTSADFRWWPLGLVLKAASASATAGTCNVWYSADLEGVTRTARLGSPLYQGPSFAAAVPGATISAGTAENVIATQAGVTWSKTISGVARTGAGWSKIQNAVGVQGWVPGYALVAA